MQQMFFFPFNMNHPTCSADRGWVNSKTLLWSKYRKGSKVSQCGLPQSHFVSWGLCQTFPSLFPWYCSSALQHCSNRMDLSLNACLCEGDGQRRREGGGCYRNENEVTACQDSGNMQHQHWNNKYVAKRAEAAQKGSGLDIVHANVLNAFVLAECWHRVARCQCWALVCSYRTYTSAGETTLRYLLKRCKNIYPTSYYFLWEVTFLNAFCSVVQK